MRDIEGIIGKIRRSVANHSLGAPGEYTRWCREDKTAGKTRGLNEYGVADAANILYTIGDFSSAAGFREGFISTLRGLQDSRTGLYSEATHHPIHTTAHCVAALELFDAKPLYCLAGLAEYTDRKGLFSLLEKLEWRKSPWNNSHKGAGIYAALVLTDSVDKEWQNDYFGWLWNEADPETGYWRKGYTLSEGSRPLYEHMAGSFHYLFNHEYAKKPLRFPEKMIDSCIKMYENAELPGNFGASCGFLQIDWIYCLTRASRQTPYRFAEVKELLEKFAAGYFDWLDNEDEETSEGFDDLHMLFGTVCAVAELCSALPGNYSADKPLKLVLDRRPFI